MDLLKDIFENTWFQRTFWALVVAIFAFLIYRVIAKFLNAKEKANSKILSSKKNKTFIHMLKSIVGYAIAIVTALMILQIYGINVTSMLAGVGIAGIVIGFALQDSLKDIIRGFNIVSDDYYEIGDVIKFGENIGPVLSISLLTTKMQDLNSMNTVSIANRKIDQVEVDNGYLYVQVPLPYEVKLDKAEPILHEIAKELQGKEKITSTAYQGITKLDESSLNYQFVVTCNPTVKSQVRREVLHTIMTTLEAHKISVPYPQLDLRTKK